MSKYDEDLLLKDESFIKFDRLLQHAESEGRIDGPFTCLVCGMHYQTKIQSVACCNLATEPPTPPHGPILGSIGKNRSRIKHLAIKQKLIVADNALGIEFTLDDAMQEVLNTLNLDQLFPEEIHDRTVGNERVLLICILSMLLEEAEGNRKSAYQVAYRNGLKMHPTKWGKMLFRLVDLEVLHFVALHDDPRDGETNDTSGSGVVFESEKETKE